VPNGEIAAARTGSAVPAPAVAEVHRRVRKLCLDNAARLPFHGWHHVNFVRGKAVEFAELNGSDTGVVEVAALVHDLNYLIRRNSPAAAGRRLRLAILAAAGIAGRIARWVDEVVDEAEMCSRGRGISLEAQALSDADTLFKSLPTTPVVLAHRYLHENNISLRALAQKIVGEQRQRYDDGFYFYNQAAAATYSRWALANLELWHCILEALDDPFVAELVGSTAPPAC
jgi:uncharacterized protein